MSIQRPNKKRPINAFIEDNEKEKPIKPQTKQMSYYLTDEIIKSINIKAAIMGKEKSEIVREALTQYFERNPL